MSIDLSADPELQALTTIQSLLAKLPDDSQARIVTWMSSRFRIAGLGLASEQLSTSLKSGEPEFSDVATLFVTANPSTGPEKALTVAFWLQECMHQEDFEGFAVNTELKHLGHGLKNITDALNGLIEHKPQLAVQLRKSGKTQQARKRYKLTVEGVRKIRQMVAGSVLS